MQQAEFEAVHIQAYCRPTSGVFSTTEYRAGEFAFETSAGSVRIISKTQPGKFVQFGPGMWWATGTLPAEPPSKNPKR